MKSSIGISRPFRASLHHFNRSLEAGKAGSFSLLETVPEIAEAGVPLAEESVRTAAGAVTGVAGFAACPASFEAIEYEDWTAGREAPATLAAAPFMPGGRTEAEAEGVAGLVAPTVCQGLSDAGEETYRARKALANKVRLLPVTQ